MACAVALSLWLRTAWSWPFVFTAWGVDFQEPDAWFHLRTAHNLLAHFPWRSGFDPYALFPGGMNMPTGPLWDYLIAGTAWIAGFGSPSPVLTDRVAAWLPAILGALCPIPVFRVTRRLFGRTAGLFAALWIAVTPGEFIWLTHLGNADHHAAEGLFSLLVFCFLCAAAESQASRLMTILAGVSLGALLATQPAAIFVPGMLAAACLFAPSLAVPVLSILGIAAITLLPVTQGLYTAYDWLSLGAAGGVAAIVWLFRARRAWVRWIALAIAGGLALGVVDIARPALVPAMLSEIGTLNKSDVAELQPVVVLTRTLAKNVEEMNLHFGLVWIPALPALAALAWLAFRRSRPPLTLFVVFSAAFTVAAFLHMRMILYFTPFAAMLAGAACGWLLDFAPNLTIRLPLSGALAAAIIVLNFSPVIERMTFKTAGAGADWYEALDWLRLHSPEPFGSSAVWSEYFPRQKEGQKPLSPAPAYGLGVWWDTGYMVEDLSHRIPVVNGFGAGVDEQGGQTRTRDMARFYASVFPDSAVNLLRKMSARYVFVDPTIASFPTMVGRSKFDAIERTAGSDSENFYRTLWHDEDGYRKPMFVYFADYYRTMGVHLYLNDGAKVRGTGPIVFRIQNDGIHDVITRAFKFIAARAADDFVETHRAENLVVGCDDPVVSCFDVEAVSGLDRVFTSDPSPISIKREIHAVKIFEVEPAPGQSR